MMSEQSPIYEGQFGTFTITQNDRIEVIIYRIGLSLACLSFCIGSALVLSQGLTSTVTQALTPLLALFILGLGISLQTIHIYLKPLHLALKAFWLIGLLSTIYFSWQANTSLANYVVDNSWCLFGIGAVFASLTGIFIKEAFCFNRLEAKFLSALIPLLILGYIFNLFPTNVEQFLLTSWCFLFIIFALRKSVQDIPSDIGDKSVFEYLKQRAKSA